MGDVIGADVHAVLQEQQPNGEWKTVIKDVLGDRNYELFGFLSEVRGSPGPSGKVAHEDFPDDFEVDENNEHDGFWMGEHSFGHFNLKEFIDAQTSPLPKPTDRYNVAKFDFGDTHGYTVTFDDDFNTDSDYNIIALQTALSTFFGYSGEYQGEKYGAHKYRVVLGYDS